MTLITEHSFFDLHSISIPTADWEEYYDDSQLEEGKDYFIGVIRDDDSEYAKSKTVSGLENQVDYIRTLQKEFGNNVTIIVQESPTYIQKGTLTIKPGDVTVYGGDALTDDDKFLLSVWAQRLSKNFLFSEEKSIVVVWGKDYEGRLLVISIN